MYLHVRGELLWKQQRQVEVHIVWEWWHERKGLDNIRELRVRRKLLEHWLKVQIVWKRYEHCWFHCWYIVCVLCKLL